MPPTTTTRTERDTMGEMQVPADAYYGASTQRAVLNFPISGLRMPRRFVRALGLLKKAAAEVFLQSDEGKGWKMEDLMEVLNDPDVRFTTSPESVMTYANFMADVGSIKNRPKAWQDMFFPEIHSVPGN